MTTQGMTPQSRARMILIREVTGGSSSTRVGGPDVTSSKGVPLSSADSLILPVLAPPPAANGFDSPGAAYDLNAIYVLSPATDTVSISFIAF